MYCPNCGSNQSEGKRFCTICGTNLQVVTQALTGQLQPAYYPPPVPNPYEIERQRETAKGLRLAIIGGGFLALKLFGAVFSGGSIVHPISFIGFILLAVGVSRLIAHRPPEGAYATVRPQTPQVPLPQNQASPVTPQPVFSSAPRTSEVHPASPYTPSVTEDKTKHLPQYAPPQELQR